MHRDKTLLLVDDDETILAMLGPVLRHVGYTVFEALSGEAACTQCAAHDIELAILDYRMPGMSGIETARQLRERFGVPFIFLTVHRDEALLEAALAAGAYGYLVKPVAPDVVVPTVEAALSRAADARHMAMAGEATGDIKVALGLLMGQERLLRAEAEHRLRVLARRQGRRMAEVARELVLAFERDCGGAPAERAIGPAQAPAEEPTC